MAPNPLGSTHGLILGGEARISEPSGQIKRSTNSQESNASDTKDNKLEIVWRNVAIYIVLHSIACYGLFLLLTLKIKLSTFIFSCSYLTFAILGTSAGSHRLWSHRTYKANLPLRIFLMLAHSAAYQNDIHEWSRDHRVHHKFVDSNADPHNASRGFFFSHVGWLMCKKHRDVIEKGKTVDMSDVWADPVVRFQRKHYIKLVLVMNLILPTMITWYFLGEGGWQSLVISVFRYVYHLNGMWLVNSAAHTWGMKPYDKTIRAAENKFVAIVVLGEGFHNYHHVFPWDYKAAELGNYRYNFTTCFMDLMAKIGWATELKFASNDMIRKRLLRTGDGSSPDANKSNNNKDPQHGHHHHDGEMIWGWGDKDMDNEEMIEIKRINRIKA